MHGPSSSENLESKHVSVLAVVSLELCQSSDLRKELVQFIHFALSFTDCGDFEVTQNLSVEVVSEHHFNFVIAGVKVIQGAVRWLLWLHLTCFDLAESVLGEVV